jgi:hypothetical protein
MRQILSRSLLTVAAASSILAATGGYASADTGAEGAAVGSAGLLSGNSVTAPIDAPVNVCGNTADAAAVGNPTFGNGCADESHSSHSAPAPHAAHSGTDSGSDDQHYGSGSGYDGGYGSDYGSGNYSGDQTGGSVATGSPGLLSGNSLDIPVQAPINACGNTVNPVGLLNVAMGNSCGDTEQTSTVTTTPPAPPRHAVPPQELSLPPAPQVHTPDAPVPAPRMDPQLAETGVGGRALGAAGATSAALLLGGAMLYRRGMRPAYAERTR